jgi:hypothetical protein
MPVMSRLNLFRLFQTLNRQTRGTCRFVERIIHAQSRGQVNFAVIETRAIHHLTGEPERGQLRLSGLYQVVLQISSCHQSTGEPCGTAN